MTAPVTDFNIRPVFHPPQYAAGPENYAAPYNRGAVSNVNWGATIFGVVAVFAVLAIAALTFYTVGCHDKACYDAVAAVGVARANASAGVPTDVDNGKVTACTGKCWDAQKVKEVAQANARAGFGSNSGTDTVTAVAPPNNIAAPAPEVKIIYMTPPAAVAPPCNRCAPKPGHATTNGAPAGRCYAPSDSPQAGQMGWLWPDGTCKGRAPGRVS